MRTSATTDSAPFASRSVTEHLARGAGALWLLVLTSKLGSDQQALALVCGLAALVLLRGCPLCWTVGLYGTLRARLRRGS
jgi:hypothetical protein